MGLGRVECPKARLLACKANNSFSPPKFSVLLGPHRGPFPKSDGNRAYEDLAKVFLADCSSGLLAVVFSDILPLNPKSFATKARVDAELAQR
jgi:hypothetical protein